MRLVREHRDEHPSEWAAMTSIAGKVGCTTETLRRWCRDPATKGEPSWPPLAMFKALLLSIWYYLSDVKLAEAPDDRASFRRFCGFAGNEATLERTAFFRLRGLLVTDQLDRTLFEAYRSGILYVPA